MSLLPPWPGYGKLYSDFPRWTRSSGRTHAWPTGCMRFRPHSTCRQLPRKSFGPVLASTRPVPSPSLQACGANPSPAFMPSKLFLIVAIGFLAVIAAQAQPANNDFAAAWALSGTAVITNGNTSQPANATKEPGEPNHAGLPGGRSVWFTWTAPLSGPTRVSTQGSAFNTLLGVYTGSALNVLAQVASNDNAPGGGNFSRVEFDAEVGTTYRIAIDGRNNAGTGTSSGSYILSLQMLGTAALSTPTNGTVVFAGTPI